MNRDDFAKFNIEKSTEFQLPDLGIEALDYLGALGNSSKIEDFIDYSKKERKIEEYIVPDNKEDEENIEVVKEEESKEENIETYEEKNEVEVELNQASSYSNQDLLEILNRQALKTHEQTPWRPKESIKEKKSLKKIDASEDSNKSVHVIPSFKKAKEEDSSNALRHKAQNTAKLLSQQLGISANKNIRAVNDDEDSRAKAKKVAQFLAKELKAPLPQEKKSNPVKKIKKKSISSGLYNDWGESLELPRETRELLDFLSESIEQYEKYINNIGHNGLSAANLGYYRDDIQEILDYFKYDEKVSLRIYWERIVKLDLQLRAKARLYVNEIGYNNFKQYQIINDPPQTSWWWYLNRTTSPPIVQKPKFWEIWKKI